MGARGTSPSGLAGRGQHDDPLGSAWDYFSLALLWLRLGLLWLDLGLLGSHGARLRASNLGERNLRAARPLACQPAGQHTSAKAAGRAQPTEDAPVSAAPASRQPRAAPALRASKRAGRPPSVRHLPLAASHSALSPQPSAFSPQPSALAPCRPPPAARPSGSGGLRAAPPRASRSAWRRRPHCSALLAHARPPPPAALHADYSLRPPALPPTDRPTPAARPQRPLSLSVSLWRSPAARRCGPSSRPPPGRLPNARGAPTRRRPRGPNRPPGGPRGGSGSRNAPTDCLARCVGLQCALRRAFRLALRSFGRSRTHLPARTVECAHVARTATCCTSPALRPATSTAKVAPTCSNSLRLAATRARAGPPPALRPSPAGRRARPAKRERPNSPRGARPPAFPPARGPSPAGPRAARAAPQPQHLRAPVSTASILEPQSSSLELRGAGRRLESASLSLRLRLSLSPRLRRPHLAGGRPSKALKGPRAPRRQLGVGRLAAGGQRPASGKEQRAKSSQRAARGRRNELRPPSVCGSARAASIAPARS